ncbi:hypothetical protein AB0L13_46815 [Saccharopolyspora shandongensis]|uniref:hypothetical protein n=1 Tax=Saccharopolyspora shandongensis TaxID=418495 RepID=UPI00342766DF
MFAAEGDVQTAFGGRERRAHRAEFRKLADHVDAVLPGLRKGLQLSIAARRGAATS